MLQGNICMFGNSKKFKTLHFDFRRRKFHVTGRRLHYLTRTGMVKSPVRSLPRLNSPQDTNTDLVSYLWVSMFSDVCKKRSGMYTLWSISLLPFDHKYAYICIEWKKQVMRMHGFDGSPAEVSHLIRWANCLKKSELYRLFLSDPGVPGPIVVSGCPSVREVV